jgi:basic membrane protein A
VAAERVLARLAQEGHKIVVATSYGYLDATLKVAERFPDVVFLHCSGDRRRANVGTYFGRMYQASYLSGLVAGKLTRRHLIGYVAPLPTPEVIRILNAFTVGAREANPDAKVQVAWTQAWFAPPAETQAANRLLDGGADVIATQSDSPAPVEAAEARGAYAVGYNSDASRFAPTRHLVSAVWNWGPYYAEVARQVRAGTWKSEGIWAPIGQGMVALSPFGPAVPEAVRSQVERRREDLVAGRFDVFWGPVRDQAGRVRVAAGDKPADAVLWSMNWLVEGVVGAIPR